ncbi:ATP-dependent DNA helicase AdnB [Winogradskya consettensis]|uniref:DNA 3'-5' helicase n=1 Tax=Winogradskya consettensis TaxID=113560 RepID=A0A919SWX0_9ACTN|nr:ATP-dependent DNA helicase [Actinoplanes consettensis]GIM78872.1 ATP-dependent DNA helicase [Actinoplanes consettensis]
MTQPSLFADAAPKPRRRADSGPRYTPDELAKLLRLHRPTPEQAAIIAAPIEPVLVVAGAGSGKTETMAARVLWLVANGYAHPDEILGLTFTRKAAGELAHRVRTRLGQLVRRLGRDDQFTGEATISTYHSYAARVVTEHGLRAGYEPSARLLTEAARWQIVDSIVRSYTGEMTGLNRAPSTVTDDVLALSGELAEHLVTPDDLAAWTGRFFADVQSLPGRVYKDVSDVLMRQRHRLTLLPLVRLYDQRKLDLEAMDFGDQMARAALVARDHPEVGAIERGRYKIVLLDEYQDTSHAQVVLLNALFGGGHPVTAVGDPCQSIYGWRGASAGTLDRFPTEFTGPGGREAWVLNLTRSWRNRPEILQVANTLSRPLRAAGARVAELIPAQRVAEHVGGRTVACALLHTYADEAEWIADSLLTAWRLAAGLPEALAGDIPLDKRPTTAVLVRVRSQIPAIEEALRSRGLPVEVVGLGGLLDTPEVRDVVCTLRVLADPTDGASLLRLLTGSRWRIGPRDLVALHRRSRAIASARVANTTGDAQEAELAEIVGDRLDDASLVEAMADLGVAQQYSQEGYPRLRAYSRELAELRHRLDQPLPDLIADIERTIGLDVEVAVRGWGAGDAGLARGHLDALGDVAARYSGETDGGTLAGFLAFLVAAEEEERGLAPGQVDVIEGAVQILTAHAAKGLEWDVVSVAGLAKNVWPGMTRGSDNYLGGMGVLPFPLRGDSDGLPVLDLGEAVDQKDVATAVTAFGRAWREHDEREERRLAYVAVTRPRRLLLASGYWWGDGVKRPRGPSVFLNEIRATCDDGAGVVDRWAPEPTADAVNPSAELVASAEWPSDPLGARRPAMAAAADLIRRMIAAPDPETAVAFVELAETDDEIAARAGLAADVTGLALHGDELPPVASAGGSTPAERSDIERWRTEVALLLAEREERARHEGPLDVALPPHLSVSQLVVLRHDPQHLARTLRRPLPARPAPYARRGTAFHSWLEQRYGSVRLLDLDELPGAADDDAAGDDELAALQQAFLAGEWAERTPIEVEVPFATTVAGIVLRGRMDAVFTEVGGRYDVIDWKTGRRPTGPAADAATVQLAAYRMAWAALADVPVSRVRAGFHYVREGVTVRPADLLDADGLAALITAVPLLQGGGEQME